MKISDIGPRRGMRAVQESLRDLRFDNFTVQQLSPTIGAELHGIDLAKPLSEDAIADIKQALVAFKVIFFRDQHISTAQHIEFAGRFGELEEHPFLPPNTDFAEMIRFDKDEESVGVENLWHSDVSWRLQPSLGSILRAITVPSVGGDTLFSDMVAAYDNLDDETREAIDGRIAVHDFSNTFGRAMDAEALARSREKFPPARHPVVRTHPESGEKILYVNAFFTSHIEDMEPEESDALLKTLFSQAYFPEYQCRFRWQEKSIAFWDNRSTQHYATSDYWPLQRVMERATIIGDIPQ